MYQYSYNSSPGYCYVPFSKDVSAAPCAYLSDWKWFGKYDDNGQNILKSNRKRRKRTSFKKENAELIDNLNSLFTEAAPRTTDNIMKLLQSSSDFCIGDCICSRDSHKHLFHNNSAKIPFSNGFEKIDGDLLGTRMAKEVFLAEDTLNENEKRYFKARIMNDFFKNEDLTRRVWEILRNKWLNQYKNTGVNVNALMLKKWLKQIKTGPIVIAKEGNARTMDWISEFYSNPNSSEKNLRYFLENKWLNEINSDIQSISTSDIFSSSGYQDFSKKKDNSVVFLTTKWLNKYHTSPDFLRDKTPLHFLKSQFTTTMRNDDRLSKILWQTKSPNQTAQSKKDVAKFWTSSNGSYPKGNYSTNDGTNMANYANKMAQNGNDIRNVNNITSYGNKMAQNSKHMRNVNSTRITSYDNGMAQKKREASFKTSLYTTQSRDEELHSKDFEDGKTLYSSDSSYILEQRRQRKSNLRKKFIKNYRQTVMTAHVIDRFQNTGHDHFENDSMFDLNAYIDYTDRFSQDYEHNRSSVRPSKARILQTINQRPTVDLDAKPKLQDKHKKAYRRNRILTGHSSSQDLLYYEPLVHVETQKKSVNITQKSKNSAKNATSSVHKKSVSKAKTKHY